MFRFRSVTFVQCAAVLFAATLGTSSWLLAQSPAPTADQLPTTYSSSQIADLQLPDRPPVHAALGMGSRSPYGRTSDLSSKIAFDFGGGFNAPHPDTTPYLTWGGQFNVGAGYNFNSRLAVLAEYQFMDDKLPGQLIAETGANGGYAHIWSLTLNPMVTLNPKSANQFYVTGGGGFYRKVTSFTDPMLGEYCGYYYCSVGTTNQVIGHFSSNQGGWSLGAGYQHRIGESRMKYFVEARYLEVLTPAITTQPNGLGTTTVGANTELIPVNFGVRW